MRTYGALLRCAGACLMIGGFPSPHSGNDQAASARATTLAAIRTAPKLSADHWTDPSAPIPTQRARRPFVIPTLRVFSPASDRFGAPLRAPRWKGIETSAGSLGYWLAGTGGNVYAEGTAPNFGGPSGERLSPRVVGIAKPAAISGYWLALENGGVYTYGRARFYGSAGRVRLKAPVVEIASTPDGRGYWLVTADGGVFSFGDARYHGSIGRLPLKARIVGISVTADGGGYWLVGADGGVFSFGDARFKGSAGGFRLAAPVVGIATTPGGGGYWLTSSDGGVFSYGDARFEGSGAATNLAAPVVAVVASPATYGYWLVTSAGDLSPFGSAVTEGKVSPPPPGADVAGMQLVSEPTQAVTNCGDSGPGSLRQAVSTAGPGVTVEFKFARPCQLIALTSGPIVLHSSITILGPGAGALAVSGLGRSGIFENPRGSSGVAISGLTLKDGHNANGHLYGGAITNNGALSVSGLHLERDSSSYVGGGISNLGDLAVSDSLFSYDNALYGGALYSNGTLEVVHSQFLQNVAPYNEKLGSSGGALYNDNSGAARLSDDEFSGNSARFPAPTAGNGYANCCYGGAVANGGWLSISASTFSGNSGGRGGAMINFGQLSITSSRITGSTSPAGGAVMNAIFGNQTATISHTTISRNVATDLGGGGGIFNYAGQLTVTSSTVSGNVGSEDGGNGPGGGIFNGNVNAATLLLEDSTVSGNKDVSGVAGVFSQGILVVVNSTIANNAGGAGGPNGLTVNGGSATVTNSTFFDDGPSAIGNFGQASVSLGATIVARSPGGSDCQGSITDLGWNLADDNSCRFGSGANDLPPGTNPILDSRGLRDNGGAIETIALEPTSPAVGFVTNAGLCPSTDERGYKRTVPCDIGAWQGKVILGSISGKVTAAAGGAPVGGGLCITVFTAGTNNFVGSSGVAANGTYTISGLPAGTYDVSFASGCGSGGDWITQWWDHQPTESTATPVIVTVGKNTGGIDAALFAGGSISGKVTAAAGGAPIGGGVCINVFTQGTNNFVGSSGVAPNGTYTISGLPPGTYDVAFGSGCGSGGDWIGQWWDNQPTESTATPVTVTADKDIGGIDAAMVAGGSISGKVTAAASGAPVGDGICVNVFTAGTNNRAGSSGIATDGTYTISGLPGGTYDVAFGSGCGSGADWVSQWWNNQPTENTATSVTVTVGGDTGGIDAAMVAGGSISGTVTAAAGGGPLGGVCISVFTAGTNNFVSTGNTASDGSYTVSSLPVGTYDVDFANPGCVSGSANWVSQWWNNQPTENTATSVTVTVGGDTGGIDAAMVAAGSISGTVTAAAGGGPLGGVCISVFTAGTNNFVSTGNTASDGTYTVSSLPVGTYDVDFANPGCVSGSAYWVSQWWNNQATERTATSVTVTVGTDTGGINAAMVGAGAISGTVTAAGGGPLSGICVTVYHAADNSFVGNAFTGPDGSYTYSGLPAGSYQAQFAPSNCGSANYLTQWWNDQPNQAVANPVTVTVGNDTGGIDAALQPGGSIAGTVTAAGGGPLSGICVTIYHAADNSFVGNAFTGPDGSYTYSGLPAGSYQAQFAPSNCGSANYLTQWWNDQPNQAVANPVTVTVGNDTGGINAALQPG